MDLLILVLHFPSTSLSLLVVTLFCGCAFGRPPDNSISAGMTRTEVLMRLKHSGAAGVAKDVAPDAKGWAVAGRDECFFLSFEHDVLTGITVEEHTSQSKIYRHWHDTKIYDLHPKA